MIPSLTIVVYPPAGEGQALDLAPERSIDVPLDDIDDEVASLSGRGCEIMQIPPSVRHLFVSRHATGAYATLMAAEGGSRAEVFLATDTVSRNHCYIAWRPLDDSEQGTWILLDQASTNGTRLDGEICEPFEPVGLAPGCHSLILGTQRWVRLELLIGDYSSLLRVVMAVWARTWQLDCRLAQTADHLAMVAREVA